MNETSMRWLSTIHAGRLWQRVAGLVFLLVLLVLLALFWPQLIAVVILLALLVLLWERIRMGQAMRELATRITTGQLSAKVEVREGAWGVLCHSVNGLVQQQHRQRRMQALLPALPTHAINALGDMLPPCEARPRTITVLIVGYAGARPSQAQAEREHLDALRTLAAVVQQQVEHYDAWLERLGDTLLLAFGAFDEQPNAVNLRNALQAARALRAAWDANSPRGPLAISLATGNVLAATLPGLGYTLAGAPIEQALRLQHLAAACPEYALLCSEEAYMTLRRLDTAPWLLTDLRLLQPNHPPQIVYALPY